MSRMSAKVILVGRPIMAHHFRRSFCLEALAAPLANRSALNRSKFLRCAICCFSCSVKGLSDGRNALLASFSRLLMTRPPTRQTSVCPWHGGVSAWFL
jgi:hypothetical protein